MNEQTDIKADKARQLNGFSRHVFLLLLPIPLLVTVGFIGSGQGWIGHRTVQGGPVNELTMSVPEAKVKDLPKDRKYDRMYGDGPMSDVNGIGITLDENSNINSRMLSGDQSRAMGIEANHPQAADELSREMGIGINKEEYVSSEQLQINSQQKKAQAWNQTQARQQPYRHSVQNSVNAMYRNPIPDKEEREQQARLAREEEQRMRANEKLLELLDKQVEQVGNPSAQASTIPQANTNRMEKPFSQPGSDPDRAYPVSPYHKMIHTTSDRSNGNSFYGLNGLKIRNERPSRVQGAIRAVVHGDGEGIVVTNGSTVALRLGEDTRMHIDGEALLLPANTLVFGNSRINGDRIYITVKTIRLENFLYPVHLVAYDLDGQLGLHVPDMKTKQQLNSSLVQGTTQLANPGYIVGGTVGQQVGGQLATQGISAALNAGKNLLARKTQQPKALIRANYQILLKSELEKNGMDYYEHEEDN